MAIQFARARYISRTSGGNAIRSAAYNAREAITAERTGEVFHFRHRDAPIHHEVLLPEGADARLADCAVLWNAAEAAEKRKNSQVAREIVLALPADRELTTDDRIELARTFAAEHFVSKGLAVQLDVHAPHPTGSQRTGAPGPERGGDGEGAYAEGTGGDHTNWHAHLLITTRRVEGDHLAARKARDLDPEVRKAGTRTLVTDAEAWGETWRLHQDRYFQAHGIELRVDAIAAHPGAHIGPVRMRAVDSPAVARAEALRTANEQAARDPVQVLAALTRNNATFTERVVERYLEKHLGNGPGEASTPEIAQDIATVKAAVLGHGEVVALHDRDTGEAVGRFTTRTVREQERTALADGAAVAGATHHHAVRPAHQGAALGLRSSRLRPDQRAAFDHAVAAGGLALIEGRAGTGKSYTLAAIHDAHARQGRRVIGLAPTNAVAQDLAADGFAEAGTVHAALFALKNGRTRWNLKTVVVVDEAAMLDSRVTGELLGEARRAGAKVILAGDDRQLASIERGGLFAELRQTARRGHDHRGDAPAGGLAAAGGARPGRGALCRGGGRVRPTRRDHLDGGPGQRTSGAGGAVEGGHGPGPAGEPVRVRLHQRRGECTQRRAPAGAARARRVGRCGRAAGDQARASGLRGGRPGAVHRHGQAAAPLQRQRRG